MEQSKTWYGMFPKYYENAVDHINTINSRKNKKCHVVSYNGDFENDLWEIDDKTPPLYKFTGKILLRDILVRLQYLAHYNENEIQINPDFCISIPILNQITEFKLRESTLTTPPGKRGWQIIIIDSDGNMPKYDQIMKILMKLDSVNLASSVLKALDTPLDRQEAFHLKDRSKVEISNVIKFILLTHVAEAAVPSVMTLKDFDQVIQKNKKIQETGERNGTVTPKHGRIPMMDKIVRAKLRKVVNPGNFGDLFSTANFPIQTTGGTANARKRALTGLEVDVLSDEENDLSQCFGTMEIKQDESKTVQIKK